MEKKFYFTFNFFLLKKTFFTEKNINETVKFHRISHFRNIFLHRKYLCYK